MISRLGVKNCAMKNEKCIKLSESQCVNLKPASSKANLLCVTEDVNGCEIENTEFKKLLEIKLISN